MKKGKQSDNTRHCVTRRITLFRKSSGKYNKNGKFLPLLKKKNCEISQKYIFTIDYEDHLNSEEHKNSYYEQQHKVQRKDNFCA